jgi:5'-nucleotidase
VVTLEILLTNDDGIHASGIAVLRRALEGLGHVTTIAPDRNTSAVARGITIDRALALEELEFGDGWRGLACDGTPSDCVRVALLGVVNPLPDLVISGVNLGGNMGADVTYSGTVGAAFEAALRGYPAAAFSVESARPGWLDEAVPVIRIMVGHVVARGLPRHGILNINLPDLPLADFAGIRPARLGGASCCDRVVLAGAGPASGSDDPASAGGTPLAGHAEALSRREYVLPCEHPTSESGIAIDFDVVAQGCVAVTPLRYDLLDPALLADLATWDLDLERVRG